MKEAIHKSGNYFLVALIVLFTGCSSDDEISKADLIGVWTVSSTSINANIGGVPFAEYLADELELTPAEAELLADQLNEYIEEDLGEEFAGTVEFRDDNTYTSNFGGGSDSGTWALSSDGKTLTFDQGTVEEAVIEVVSLTANNLKIKFTEEMDDVDIDDDGMVDDVDVEIEINLTK